MDMVENTPSQLSEVCRLCSSTEGKKLPIFGDDEELDPLSLKILVCVSVEVNKDDILSTLICQPCLNHITDWHQFKQLCDSAQAKQKEWLSKLLRSSPLAPDVYIKTEPNDDVSDIIIQEENIEEDVSADVLGEPEIKMEDLDDYCTEDMSSDADATTLPANEPLNYHVSHSEHQLSELKKERQSIAISLGLNAEQDEPGLVDITVANSSMSANEAVSSRRLGYKSTTSNSRDAILSCPQCSQRFTTAACLQRHLLIHTGARYQCTVCQLALSSPSSRSRHMLQIHGDVKPYRCVGCRIAFVRRSELCAHRRTCGAFAQRTSTSAHTGPKKIKGVPSECAISYAQGSSKGALQKHTDKKHSVSCRLCSSTFADKVALMHHMKLHNKQPKKLPTLLAKKAAIAMVSCPKCPLCHKHFKVSALKRHMTSHTVVKGFCCPICRRHMKYASSVQYHLLHVHQVVQELKLIKTDPAYAVDPSPAATHARPPVLPVNKEDSGAGPSGHKFACNFCDRSFSSKGSLQTHYKSIHKAAKDYKCKICSQVFLQQALLDAHKKASHVKQEVVDCVASSEPSKRSAGNTYKCTVCPKVFDNKFSLISHQNRSRHNLKHMEIKMKIFSCSLCQNSYNNELALRTHRSERHGVEVSPPKLAGEYDCHMCSMSLSNNAHLKRHIQNFHLKGVLVENGNASTTKPSKLKTKSFDDKLDCDICGKCFKSASGLRAHKRWHYRVNGASPKLELPPREHNRKHAPNADTTEVLTCNICKKSFESSKACKLHITKAHSSVKGEQLQTATDSETTAVQTTPVVSATSYNPLELEVTCHVCQKEFQNPKSCRMHFIKAHIPMKRLSLPGKLANSGPSSSTANTPLPLADNTVITCGSCPKTFNTERGRKIHLTTVHGVATVHARVKREKILPANEKQAEYIAASNDVIPPSNQEEFPCPLCQKSFSSSEKCKTHVCHKHAVQSPAYVKHLVKPDTAVSSTPTLEHPNLLCDLCSKSFQTPRAFNIHYAWHRRNPSSIDNGPDKIKKQTMNDYAKNMIANTAPILKRMEPVSSSLTLAQMQRNAKRSLPILMAVNATETSGRDNKPDNAQLCHICKQAFPSGVALRNHVHSHNESHTITVQDCSYCRKTYSNKWNLATHLKTCKLNVKRETLVFPPYTVDCHFCQETFSKKSYLRFHLKACTKRTRTASEVALKQEPNVARRQCKFCLAVVSHRHNLLRHEKSCQLANQRDNLSPVRHAKLKKINKVIHLSKERSATSKVQPSSSAACLPIKKVKHVKKTKTKNPKQLRHRCNLCRRNFLSHRSLLSHRMWHSRKSNVKLKPVTTSSVKASALPQISASVKLPATRNSHLLKEWPCDMCSQLFLGKKALAIHRNTHNLSKEGFSHGAQSGPSSLNACKTCDKTFKTPDFLRSHIVRVHVKAIFSQKLNGNVK